MVADTYQGGGIKCPVTVYPYSCSYQDCVNCQIMKAAQDKENELKSEPSYQHLKNILGVKIREESYKC